MYTIINYKSKKALKEAVAALKNAEETLADAVDDTSALDSGEVAELRRAVDLAKNALGVYSPGPFPCPTEGRIALEGPHYPQPHKWYAEAVVRNGIVVSVK